MYRRRSSIKSARTFRLAASSASKPRSSNTLSLPRRICRSLSLLPRLSASLLDRLITLPTDREVVLGRFLCFLGECVEYIDSLLELGDIENPVGIASLNANFIGTRTKSRHGLEIARILPPLHCS